MMRLPSSCVSVKRKRSSSKQRRQDSHTNRTGLTPQLPRFIEEEVQGVHAGVSFGEAAYMLVHLRSLQEFCYSHSGSTAPRQVPSSQHPKRVGTCTYKYQ